MNISKSDDSFFVKLEIGAESSERLEKAFRLFLKQPKYYKEKYLQKYAPGGLQGYSYMGQKDSKNQYAEDLLHSFVLSDAYGFSFFPEEFQEFCNICWTPLVEKIKTLEQQILVELGLENLRELYSEHLCHQLSCNYYPAVDIAEEKRDCRLSVHEDISLFTTFVFGSRRGFSYQSGDQFFPLEDETEIVIFPGYFLEMITKGKVKALKHRVELRDMDKERFSFAFFSIPAPEKDFTKFGAPIKSEEYYNNYLSLF